MKPMDLTELRGVVTQWYACQVYGNKPTNKAAAQEKEERAYRLIEELERLSKIGSYIEKLYKANGNEEYLEKLKEWANKE